MCRRNFLFPEEAEAEVNEIRKSEGIDSKTEKLIIKDLVKNAKVNSRIGDKVLICIDPKYIHYPEWQREIRLPKALSIGNNYDSKRWDYLLTGIMTDYFGRLKDSIELMALLRQKKKQLLEK